MLHDKLKANQKFTGNPQQLVCHESNVKSKAYTSLTCRQVVQLVVRLIV